jgi:hypothetical protein
LSRIPQDLAVTYCELPTVQLHLIDSTKLEVVIDDVDFLEVDTKVLVVDLPEVKQRVLTRKQILTNRAVSNIEPVYVITGCYHRRRDQATAYESGLHLVNLHEGALRVREGDIGKGVGREPGQER